MEQARPVSVPFARGGEHGLGPFGLGPARVSFFFPHIIRVVFLFLFERELVGESSAPENLCGVVKSPLAQRAVATLTRAVQG